jgi:outer membrane protein OmpA-like peptidoglycan-associated protein
MLLSVWKKILLVLILSCSSYIVHAQQYYVVIGAFAKESNAKKFSGFARSRFFQATYEINPLRNLYYVYVIKSSTKKEAVDQVLILQKEESFSDSWVFRGSLGTSSEKPEVKSTPVAQTKQPEILATKLPVAEEPILPDPVVKDSVAKEAIAETKPEPEVKPANESVPRKAKGKFFKFTILSPAGEPIAGKVHHVDLKQGRDIASYNSNDYSDVLRPSNREEPMTIICGIFGYKEVTQLVDYAEPSLTTGASQDANGIWNIPFSLERLKKGDVSVMYDVSFYKDAVVMLPRSQEELDELVSMMQTNANYKIKIHGHANGNTKRKIIALGKNRNYFDVKGSNQKNGTSKELSKLRAEAVQEYLTTHGIDKKRMEIMAWGGTNMLVSETSPSAKLNDRIEIEILED